MPVFRSHNYIGLCTLLFAGSIALATEVPEDAIARCAKIASVGERILCLENALRQSGTNAQGTPEEAARDTGPVGMESVEIPEQDAAIIGVIATDTGADPHSAPGEPVSREAVDVEASPDNAVAEELGAEQVAARNATIDQQPVARPAATNLHVAAYSTVPYERLVVELDNGQVWRQIKGDVQRIRVDLERNQTVDISESRFGGYQLRLNEIRRTIRVERIK